MAKLLGCIDTMDELTPLFGRFGFSPDTEAINLQADSTFPKELISMFDRIFKFSSEHDKAHGEISNSDDALAKHSRMRLFIKKDIKPLFVKTVKKHTGMTLSDLITALPTNFDNISSVYCWLSGCDKLTSDILISAQGASEDQLDRIQNSTIDKTLKMNDSFDRAKGKILGDVKALKVKIGLPIGIFCIKDFMPPGYAKYQPNSEEIAAAILHEIGHVFGWVEYMADIAYSGYYGNNVLRAADSQIRKDPKQAKASIKKAIAAGKRSGVILPDIGIVLDKSSEILDTITIDSDFEVTKAEKAEYKLGTLAIFGKMLFNLMISISYAGATAGIYAASPLLMGGGSSKAKGSREFSADEKNNTIWERLADEYVSRFKMSKHLNTMLMKLGGIFKGLGTMGYGGPVFSKTMKYNYIVRSLVVVGNLPVNLFNYVIGTVFYKQSSYEADIKRYKRNISNTIDLLKDSSLPANIRNEVVADVEKMERDLKRMSFVIPNMMHNFIKFVILLPPKIMHGALSKTLGSGGLSNEYSMMLNKLDDLLSNRANLYAAKIASIFDK